MSMIDWYNERSVQCSNTERSSPQSVLLGAARLMAKSYGTPRQRFDESYVVNNETGCWEWSKCRHQDGYGKFAHSPGKNKPAHRAAWEFHRGDIPVGMCVCHHCDNRSCVNPDHLFLGTQSENTLDKTRKSRGGMALRPEQVRKIRCLIDQGIAIPEIARMFGVTYRSIWLIKRGETWRYVA